MGKINSVLFVCTGNSCRSVMAEALLKKRLKELGKAHIKVSSAGVMAMDARPPTDETIAVMRSEGVDLAQFRSRSITEQMIKASDLILVMEAGHRCEVIKLVPEAAGKTFMLKEYGWAAGSQPDIVSDVPDPIGESPDVYNKCMQCIKKNTDRIAEYL